MIRNLNIDGCTALGEAIVAQAGIDYLDIRKQLEIIEDGIEKKILEKKLNEIERFFKSKRFELMTEVDGDHLKAILDERFEEMKKSGEL